MLKKEEKKEIVKKLREKLRENKLAVFCNFEGITFRRQQELKNKFKENNSEIFVVKNSLLKRALMEESIEFPPFSGSIMLGIGRDEVLPAKLIGGFGLEKKEKLIFVGGVLNENGKLFYLTKEEVETIAKLPSREELLARLIGMIKAPISNLTFVLQANIQKLVYILSQIPDK